MIQPAAESKRWDIKQPCPFCGQHTTSLWKQMFWRVECECGGAGPMALKEQEAMDAWDKRA